MRLTCDIKELFSNLIFFQLKDLSVIIVNFKGGKKLLKCLQSLESIKDKRFSFEVIVVDNHSNDGNIAKLVELFPQFNFIYNTGNNGFANGCNLGAANSIGINLLFLNPDTVVNSDALFDMLEEVRVRPEFSIISCRQVKKNGLMDRSYGKFATLFTLTGWMRGVSNFFSGHMDDSMIQTKHYLYPDWVSGSVIMIRRDSFFRLGKWDEDYWMYFEDVDLCRRAMIRNGEIVMLKYASVRHSHGGSSRISPGITVMTKTEVDISRHVYVSKHEDTLIAFFMHLFLIFNNLVIRLLPALLGLPLFFVKRLLVFSLTYFKLARYYLNVIKAGTWLSERSVNYSLKDRIPEAEEFYSRVKQVYHHQL
jgi:GT2 family glycosyltransferase